MSGAGVLDRLEALSLLGEAVGRASDVEEIFGEALAALQRAVAPDRASMLLFDDDGVMRFKAWRGLSEAYRRETEGHSPWGPDDVEAAPILVPDVEQEPSLDGLRHVIVGEGIRALAFVPLVTGGRVLGKFMLYHDRPHDFEEQEVALARAVAGYVAFAIDRMRSEEALTFQKNILELQSEASTDGILVVSRDGRMSSFNRRFVEMWNIPEEVIGSRSDEAALESVLDQLVDPDGFRSRVAYLYEHPNEESSDELALLDGRILDRRSAPVQAEDGSYLGRVWFFRDVTDTRRAEEEQRFLVDAADVLSSSLDQRQTLRRLARLAVPRVCDWCVIYVQDEEGRRRRVEAAHSEGPRGALLRDLLRSHPPDLEEGPISKVLRFGASVLLEDLGDGVLERWAGQDAGLLALGQLGLVSAMIVPLRSGGSVLGAAAFLSSESGRRYHRRDLLFAEELGRRAASAVENGRLHQAERRARQSAERAARESLRLQSVTADLSGALTATEVGEVVVTQAVGALGAHAGAVYALSDDGRYLELLASAGYERDRAEDWRRLPADMPSPGVDALRSGELVVVESGRELADRWPNLASVQAATGDEAAVAAPLRIRGRDLGLFYAVFRRPRAFTRDEKRFITTLSRQCAQALERAQLYEVEHRTAETLQRSLLPERLPVIPGVAVAARYLPSEVGAEVGGDWYDVFRLPGDRAGVVVGDVEGSGVKAAAAMGRLRNALHAYALEGASPATALSRLNSFAFSSAHRPFATIFYTVIDGSRCTLTFASAGHPPPMVVGRDGRARHLEGAVSVPIGTVATATYREETVALEPGTVVVLYTDGLVERRRSGLDEGLAQLERVLSRPPPELESLLDQVVRKVVPGGREDDVAVLAVRLDGAQARGFKLSIESEARSLSEIRARVRAWLSSEGVGEEEAADIVLAIGEAATNAIEHAQDPDPQTIAVEGEIEAAVVEVSVRDFGRWRAPARVAYRGRGMKLMRAVMDEVEVVPGSGGTEVRMRRRLDHLTEPPRVG